MFSCFKTSDGIQLSMFNQLLYTFEVLYLSISIFCFTPRLHCDVTDLLLLLVVSLKLVGYMTVSHLVQITCCIRAEEGHFKMKLNEFTGKKQDSDYQNNIQLSAKLIISQPIVHSINSCIIYFDFDT